MLRNKFRYATEFYCAKLNKVKFYAAEQVRYATEFYCAKLNKVKFYAAEQVKYVIGYLFYLGVDYL